MMTAAVLLPPLPSPLQPKLLLPQAQRRTAAAAPPPPPLPAATADKRCGALAAAATRRSRWRRRGGSGQDASSTSTSSPPPPAQQLLRLPPVALDVEYAHVAYEAAAPSSALAAGANESTTTTTAITTALPAWVALVDEAGSPLLKTYVDARGELLPPEPGGAGPAAETTTSLLRAVGGVPLDALRGAPPLRAVVAELRQLAAGKLLLGHHLAKDLAALGWRDHPVEARLDTMTHAAFGNRAGNARSLRRLARDFLDGRVIQRPGVPHDPEEDASAVMALFLRHVRPSVLAAAAGAADYYYAAAVAAAEAQLLAEIEARRRQRQQLEEEEGV